MTLGQSLFNLGLRLAKQIECGVKLVLIHSAQLQHRPQRMSSGCLAELARRRELGRRLDHPGHDHSQCKLREPGRRGRQQLVQAELPRQSEHGGHVAVRQRALDPKLVPEYDGRLALQHPP